MMVQAMRCLAVSTGGWRARIDCATVMRARPVAGGEDLLGRAREHAGAVGMLGEGLRELHPGVGGAPVPGRPCRRRCRPSSPFW